MLFRETHLVAQSVPPNDKGWKTYIPRLFYTYLVKEVLSKIRAEPGGVAAMGDSNLGESFSVKEFNSIFEQEYCSFMTQGNEGQQAIVYHTTITNRNRYPGWYHPYIPADPNIVILQEPSATTQVVAVPRITPRSTIANRSDRDNFWGTIVVQLYHSDPADNYNMFPVQLGSILVGHKMIALFPDLVGGNQPLKVENIASIYHSHISKSHTFSSLWPDLKKFTEYVQNTNKKVLQFRGHPFDDVQPVAKRRELLERHRLCVEYHLQQEGEEEPAMIRETLNQGNFGSILSLGLTSMYDGYVEFLCDLRIRYDDHRRQQSSGANRRITANELHKRWMRDGIG